MVMKSVKGPMADLVVVGLMLGDQARCSGGGEVSRWCSVVVVDVGRRSDVL